jgi:hypothetical protein
MKSPRNAEESINKSAAGMHVSKQAGGLLLLKSILRYVVRECKRSVC